MNTYSSRLIRIARQFNALAIALLAVTAIGCGQSSDLDKVVVRGTVTFDGQPIPNGELRFIPINGTKGSISGGPIKDGVYVAQGRGGVPIGEHRVEIKAYRPAAKPMGVVYKGQHAMLRRPTAIKLLDADKVTDESIARFEREVQITSQLSHPNTVAIYDYGRTPEGVFYYAMEYIEGIDLQALVDQYGPQPPARVIHLLRQICGSLYEAHSKGMVHRDIKPANLMLTRRGGESDVMKVLDFGLVKARDEEGDEKAAGLAGTPLYMSPEAIQMPASVDACSDLYAVGAVGYFLLTGHPVFEASSVVELCQKHIDEPPTPPSERLGKPLPLELETAILACLEKSRAKRPQTARDLAQRLERCPVAVEWTVDYAESWWSQHDRGRMPVVGHASSTTSNEYAATIAHK